DEDDDDAAFITAAMQKQNKKGGTDVLKKTVGKRDKGKNKTASGLLSGGGSFQSMGLHPSLLRSLLLRGFTTPTPIQRQTIPAILEQPPRDVVGMARTGSGKTLAYLVPLIQRLNGRHSSTVGVKSIILCPSRELALQILRVGKEIARGWKADEGGEAIRWGLIVGGEGLDEQFALMATNPDVIIATPGRLLHLAVEMNLDLKSTNYVVFDEADRLFEMGFASQLEEILLRLPDTRQTLLFSATLPKTLVEFARAGLQSNPKLVRLDADSKISEDLRMAFLSIKPAEKEAALLLLLRDIIGVPQGEQRRKDGRDNGWQTDRSQDKKRKRSQYGNSSALSGADDLLPYQTIIFAATKHHVEYLLLLLTTAGYSCSHIYSSLDQAARGLEMKRFRDGESSLLIVTDVAARGIDLPVLEHVINYDFPSSPRVFVHRVGRTARAGKRGFAWNLVHHSELPYLCDLQLFLARPLVAAKSFTASIANMNADDAMDLHTQLVLGTLPRDALDNEIEYINESLTNSSSSAAVAIPALKKVVQRAHQMYTRSQTKASQESYRRAKEMVKAGDGDHWALAGSVAEESSVHDVIKRPKAYGLGRISSDEADVKAVEEEKQASVERAALLAKINGFRPSETVFEVGSRGATPNALLMKDRRRVLDGKRRRADVIEAAKKEAGEEFVPTQDAKIASKDDLTNDADLQSADEEDILQTFDVSAPAKRGKSGNFRDESVYMDYEQRDARTEKGYSLNTGDSFVEQAKRATFNLAGDDESRLGTQSQIPNAARWDTKKKKFIQGNGVGADNKKMIKTESGKMLPASFRSGRFDEWSKEQRMEMQRVGGEGEGRDGSSGGRKFMHHSNKPMRKPDRFQDDYKQKMNKFKARTAKSELKSAMQIHKDRTLANKRKEKNARPSQRGRGRR
ncbi:DEAD-domain-containing protein, partial [Meira miltonrushii]